MACSTAGSGEQSPSRCKKSLKRLLAEKRIEKLPHCGSTGHLAVGFNIETQEVEGFYHPHSCGSLFCPYCSKRKRIQILRPYKELLKRYETHEVKVFITTSIRNGFDIHERVEVLSKSLTRLYELKIFGKRKWREVRKAFFEELKEYRENLKRKGLKPKEIRRKVKLQVRLFKKFVNRYRNLPDKEKKKLGQILNVLWAFELTYNPETGYHPHLHGIGLGEIPKVLLTVLWRMATKGEGEIVDVRKVKDMEEAFDYLEDYLADGFIDLGDFRGVSKEQMIEVEEALHGRRKVRVWGFDLLKGQQLGLEGSGAEGESGEGDNSWLIVHARKLGIKILIKERKNLYDYWKEYRKARKEGKERPYFVGELENGEYYYGKRLVLLGYITPEGRIRLEPVEIKEIEGWKEFLQVVFENNGNVSGLYMEEVSINL